MLEKIYMIKYILETILDDDELRDIIVIGLFVFAIARIASNNVVGNFTLWWAFNSIADAAFLVMPIALAARSLWAWIHITDLFTEEEMNEIEEVL